MLGRIFIVKYDTVKIIELKRTEVHKNCSRIRQGYMEETWVSSEHLDEAWITYQKSCIQKFYYFLLRFTEIKLFFQKSCTSFHVVIHLSCLDTIPFHKNSMDSLSNYIKSLKEFVEYWNDSNKVNDSVQLSIKIFLARRLYCVLLLTTLNTT